MTQFYSKYTNVDSGQLKSSTLIRYY